MRKKLHIKRGKGCRKVSNPSATHVEITTPLLGQSCWETQSNTNATYFRVATHYATQLGSHLAASNPKFVLKL